MYKNFPVLCKVSDMRKFLGVCSWYSQFVDNYPDMIASLTEHLKQGVQWVWMKIEQRAFENIKSALYNSPKFFAPDYWKAVLSTNRCE